VSDSFYLSFFIVSNTTEMAHLKIISVKRCISIIFVQQFFVIYDDITKIDKIMCEDTDRNFLTQDTLGPIATLLKYSKINYIPFNGGNPLLAHQDFCSTCLYTHLKLKTTNDTY